MSNLEYYTSAVKEIKYKVENAIKIGGKKSYDSVIKGKELIQPIHDAIKLDLIKNNNIDNSLVYPPLFNTKPEIKLVGEIISKRQDICVLPKNIEKKSTFSDVYTYKNLENDKLGIDFTNHCLVINVKSQLSSLNNNFSNIYTGFIGENADLKIRCPNIVNANFLMIPLYEYDSGSIKNKEIKFKKKQTDVEKYISAANKLINNNHIGSQSNNSKNERFGLLIVDFRKEIPYIYTTSDELLKDGIVSKEFLSYYSYEKVNILNFIRDLLRIYKVRYNLKNILK